MRVSQSASFVASIALFIGLSPMAAVAQRGAPHVRSERRDLRQIASIAAAWDQAVRSGDSHAERRADRRLERWLQEEIAESASELTEEQRALGEETASEETVEMVTSATGQSSEQVAQARDARTDLRYVRAVAVELRRLAARAEQGTLTSDERARKRSLLRILVTRARQEVREDRARARSAGR